MPCDHALPPNPLEIVEAKISGICIEEISLWPLEPLSTTPPPEFAGAPRVPLPPPVKVSPAPRHIEAPKVHTIPPMYNSSKLDKGWSLCEYCLKNTRALAMQNRETSEAALKKSARSFSHLAVRASRGVH